MTTPATIAHTMSARHHAAATSIAAVFGHDKVSLADRPDLLAQYLQAGRDAANAATRAVLGDLRAEVAEVLYDADHDNCDEQCTGGGMHWYQQVAARLVDPHSAVTFVARHVEFLNDHPGYDRANGWLWLVDDRRTALDETEPLDDRRRLIAEIAAAACLEIARLDHEDEQERAQACTEVVATDA